MSAESPRRSSGSSSRGVVSVPAIVPPQVVSDRSILDSAIGFINEVTLAHQPSVDSKDTITWARFETNADISDSRYGEDWELEGNVAPPLLLILGYGKGVQVWAIPANGEAVEVLSWRHGIVSALRILPTPLSRLADDENGRADEPNDTFAEKRPLIALVDGTSAPGSQPQFCAVNFISLKTGAQIKTIKFKNPVVDILANRNSIVITFHERIAVFDARTLEDRLSITTCYPSPGINPNPAALGPRWLAYADNKLLHTKRSGGGCDGDGVASYTATVLNASKSLVKGLRELGEQVAAGLTGTSGSGGNSKNSSFDSGCGIDTKQPGIVTIIDIKSPLKDYSPTSGILSSGNQTVGTDTMIAHFIAHSDALVAIEFDNSGMLLVTADRRGHDFHVFRIQPNPVGPSLAAVHHLYILHRGDTSAKVQNITLTLDSRWVAVSTLRGTTHVFPITPYGGTMGVRTHSSLHVVNKLSRFHRSAGLSGEGRSNSPISHSESATFSQSLQPYNNSTIHPFPRPTIVMPLAQLRQPFVLGSPPGSGSLVGVKSVASVSGSGSQRQRLSSLSDDSGKPLSVCAIFAKSRSWLLDPPNVTREAPHRMQRRAVDSLFIMAGHGALIQYDLGTKLASNIPKEKICDDTPIELEVEAKAQWNLGRRKEVFQEIMPPLSPANWLIKNRNSCILTDSTRQYDDSDERSESWLSQVEIITHAGPHRRLWMGPQFVFKTYNTPSGSNLNHVDVEAVEIGTIKPSSSNSSEKLDHSTPLNMPLTAVGRSSAVPVLIESGSYSSIEQSPKLMDRFRHDHLDSDYSVAHGDSRLKEDLADAMRESPCANSSSKDAGGHVYESGGSSDNVTFFDALTPEDDHICVHANLASAAALASVLPNIHSYDIATSNESFDLAKNTKGKIEKIVNPLGTVTTITSCLTPDVNTDILDEVVSQLAVQDAVIHENCDESLFRPVVAIFCDEKTFLRNEEETRRNTEKYQPPEVISSKLVVPVIEKDLNDELSKREKEKNSAMKCKTSVHIDGTKDQSIFEQMSLLNRKSKECIKAINFKQIKCVEEHPLENKSEHLKSSVLKSENPVKLLIENIDQNKNTECGKNKMDDIKITAKKRTSKEPHIPKQRSREVKEIAADIKTVRITPKQIHPEAVFGKQTNMVLQDSCEEIKEHNSNGKNLVSQSAINATKIISKHLISNEKDGEEQIQHTAEISKEKTLCKSVEEISADFKSVASITSCSIDQKAAKATNAIGDILEKKTEPSINTAVHGSTKSHTAIKDKINKKSKDSMKSNKLCSTGNKINVQQITDSLVEMNSTESKIKDNDTNETKAPCNKAGNDKITVFSNPFIYEEDGKFNINAHDANDANVADNVTATKHDSEFLKMDSKDIFKTLENPISTNSKNVIGQKKNTVKETCKEALSSSDCVEQNKYEKIKGIDILSKEQQMGNENITESLELNLSKSESEPIYMRNDLENKSCEVKCENKIVKKLMTNNQHLDSIKQSEETCGKNTKIDKNRAMHDKEKKLLSQIECTVENLRPEHDDNGKKKNIIKQKIEDDEDITKAIKDKTTGCDIFVLDEISTGVCNNSTPTKMKYHKTNEMKGKLYHNLSDSSLNCATVASEIKKKIPATNSGADKELRKETPKYDVKKHNSCNKKGMLDPTNVVRNKEEKMESHGKEDIIKSKSETSEKEVYQSSLAVYARPNKVESKLSSPTLPPTISAWKTLSGADMINKTIEKSDSVSYKSPPIGTGSKIINTAKLLPELPTPADIEKTTNLNEFSHLKTALPPLPILEPLQITTDNNISPIDISLITFESPLLENRPLQRKITVKNRGFTEENLIFALCGSLHYENEHCEKTGVSPTFSSNHSSSVFEDTSLPDCKSMAENEDNYMSLEQSSQEANTTNSSGSEEIIIMEEKKMTKKQKRKKQQQLKEVQSRKELNNQQELYDEELRPLIAMTDSQIDQTRSGFNEILPVAALNYDKNEYSATQSLTIYSTTTDSEGPLPATTSDDNGFCIPVPIVHNPHKIKTKKLEHKINLIAAIEAATSSSTSSAEESGVELGGRSSHENNDLLTSELNTISSSAIQQLPTVSNTQTSAGALKKKTKRRKR